MKKLIKVEVIKLGGAFFVPEYILNFFKEFKNTEKTLFVVSAIKGVTRLLDTMYHMMIQKDIEEEFKKNMINLSLNEFSKIHLKLIDELFEGNSLILSEKNLKFLLDDLKSTIFRKFDDKNKYYASLLKYGELASSKILSEYLEYIGISNTWFDARNYVITKGDLMNAEVINIISSYKNFFERKEILITQGFIAKSENGNDAVLGFDGSDKSAAEFAIELASGGEFEVTISFFKDQLGVLNGNPTLESNLKILSHMTYEEYFTLCKKTGTAPVRLDSIIALWKSNSNIKVVICSYIDLTNPGTYIYY